jgi:hypothetical protein
MVYLRVLFIVVFAQKSRGNSKPFIVNVIADLVAIYPASSILGSQGQLEISSLTATRPVVGESHRFQASRMVSKTHLIRICPS